MAFDRNKHKRGWSSGRNRHRIDLIGRWKRRKGCQICGYNKHHAGLVLDHIDPTTKDRSKRASGRSYNTLWKIERIKLELSKCQVLCATCHNVRSYEEKHSSYRPAGAEFGIDSQR